MAVWYPAARRERYPLIIFSHGWGGCGTQSLFLTESLARAGYVVAAPDHRDATCSVDGPRLPRFHLPELPFSAPGHWTESTYEDRREDLEEALDWMLANAEFRTLIDPARIGAMGHSLGGYSALGLTGGWDSWKDPRITAVLALAPYLKPLVMHGRLREIQIPVMYQDAQFDMAITPSVRGPKGAFAQSGEPKYLVELRGGNHFEWTNAVCFGHSLVEDCLEKRANLTADRGLQRGLLRPLFETASRKVCKGWMAPWVCVRTSTTRRVRRSPPYPIRMKLGDLALALGCALQGDSGIEITGVAGLEQSAADQLTFLANPKYAHKVKQTRAGAILVRTPIDGIAPAQLVSANPYLDFARALELFYEPPRPPAGIHPTASIAASARIGENASIGPYSVVGENVAIGRGAVLRPHVVIYDGATIGDDFYAHSHAVVREFCRIGDRVTLQNSVVVGGDGFGFAKRCGWHSL